MHQASIGGCEDCHPCYPLVRELRGALREFGQVVWGHVFREPNSIADALAKYGMGLELGLRVFDSLLSFCSIPFISDSPFILEACSSSA